MSSPRAGAPRFDFNESPFIGPTNSRTAVERAGSGRSIGRPNQGPAFVAGHQVVQRNGIQRRNQERVSKVNGFVYGYRQIKD